MFSLTLVVVVHSACTSRTIWQMHNTNRRLGIVFKWAIVVFIVCVVLTFFMSYVLYLARTDPDLYQDICQKATGKVNTVAQLMCSFLSEQEAKVIRLHKKWCWSKKLCFVRQAWLLHNISRPTRFPTAFVFVTSATRTLKKHEMLGMNRSKGVQEWFTSLVKSSSSAKYPLIYTFMQGSKTISEHLNLNDTDCNKALET